MSKLKPLKMNTVISDNVLRYNYIFTAFMKTEKCEIKTVRKIMVQIGTLGHCQCKYKLLQPL